MNRENNQMSGSQLRLVAWEVTRRCNLNCIHCRASSELGPYAGELGYERCLEILEEIGRVSRPIIILTGGEPLLRPDVFDIAKQGAGMGFRMVMATNGTLISEDIAEKMKDSGVQRVSISIDAPTEQEHDSFRKVPGAFKGALKGISVLRKSGVEFQINTTITRQNAHRLDAIMGLAVDLGAVAHHIFLLVPTGRAKEMADQEITADEYERILFRLCSARESLPLHVKATCAPHYYRVLRQEADKKGEKVTFEKYGLDAVSRGCLGGTSFCFISHVGVVQPCGYLELRCGDLKSEPFHEVWQKSEVFLKLRDFSQYKGKCGKCEYLKFCGGCRARAFEKSGDYLYEEPLCSYVPKAFRTSQS